MRLRVVVGQLAAGWQPATNTARIANFLRDETRPGELVVLPEAALSGYDDDLSGLATLDEREIAASVAAIAAAARAARIHVLCGTLWPEGGAWFNAGLYFGPAGERWSYRKVNLATHERGRLRAGDSLPLLRLAAGPPGGSCPAGPVAVGVQLCRELKYPEQWHVLARNGASVLAYLTYAANPAIPAGVWRSHLVSRAAETQRFVVAANVASPSQHCPSMIISPRGDVLAESLGGVRSAEPQVLRAELDLAEVSDQTLSQQRADVVGIIAQG